MSPDPHPKADLTDRAALLGVNALPTDLWAAANLDDLDDAPDEDEMDDDADQEDESDPHVERALDKGLKETFPASDPVSINPGAD